MILETKRLRLREWQDGEEYLLKQFLGDDRVMYAYEGGFDDEKIKEWLVWNQNSYKENGYGLWAVELKENNSVIGECGLTNQTIGGTTFLEIGYHLTLDSWQKGYMIEAAKAVKTYAFDVLGASEVVSIVRDTNIASMNVAIRNGMTVKKRVIKHYKGIDMPHYIFEAEK